VGTRRSAGGMPVGCVGGCQVRHFDVGRPAASPRRSPAVLLTSRGDGLPVQVLAGLASGLGDLLDGLFHGVHSGESERMQDAGVTDERGAAAYQYRFSRVWRAVLETCLTVFFIISLQVQVITKRTGRYANGAGLVTRQRCRPDWCVDSGNSRAVLSTIHCRKIQ
jgi:hypothetical protein